MAYARSVLLPITRDVEPRYKRLIRFNDHKTSRPLAKKGALAHFLGVEPVCVVSWPKVNSWLQTWARARQLKRWSSIPGQALVKDIARKLVVATTGHEQFTRHCPGLDSTRGLYLQNLCSVLRDLRTPPSLLPNHRA